MNKKRGFWHEMWAMPLASFGGAYLYWMLMVTVGVAVGGIAGRLA